MAALEPGKPRECQFLRKSVKPGKVRENVEERYKSGKETESFWFALDSQHFCSKLGVAAKGMTLNASLKSSRPTLPPFGQGRGREKSGNFD